MISRLAGVERALVHRRDASASSDYLGFFPSLYCNVNAVFGNMLSLFIELEQRCGGGEKMLPIRFDFLGKPAVLVTNPRHVQQVFKDDEHFSVSADPQILARFRALLGFNLISVEHETWSMVRPRTTAFLNGRPLSEYGEVMRTVMAEECLPFFRRAAATGTPIDVFESMLEFSSKVVFRSFMRLGAAEVPDAVHPALSRLFGHIRRQVFQPGVPLWVPTPANTEFKRDRDIVRDFVRPFIDAHKTRDTMLGSIVRAHTRRSGQVRVDGLVEAVVRAWSGEGGDVAVLAAALAARARASTQPSVYQLGKELARVGGEWAKQARRTLVGRPEQLEAALESVLCEGGEIDRELVLQEMVSNLIGGSETTILQMTWGLYYMSRFPAVQERLHREVAEDPHEVPLIEHSTMRERWRYLYNVLRETLRLASPAALFNRPVIADVSLDGHRLAPGTIVWGSQYITHRSPYVWPEPERFMPERFEQPIAPGAFFPFTLGQRMCVGMNYAFLEAAIALATLAKHFRFSCTSGEVGYEMGITYRPDRPVHILLEAR